MELQLQEGEEVIYQDRPRKVIVVIWLLMTLIFITPFSILASLAVFASYAIETILLFTLIFSILILVYQIALVSTYRYYITNERVIFEGGILLRRLRSVPFYKITNFSLSQNIGERLLGLFSLNIHTAGTGTTVPEIKFVGLKDSKAYSLVTEKMRELKEKNPQFHE